MKKGKEKRLQNIKYLDISIFLKTNVKTTEKFPSVLYVKANH